MQNLLLSAITTAATANILQSAEVEPIPRTGNQIYMIGSWSQTQLDGNQQLVQINFEVGGAEWPDHTMVQTWVQLIDPDNQDEMIAFTCTAQYSQNSLFATTGEVKNFFGPSSFDTQAVGTQIKFDEINDIDFDADGHW